MVEGLDNAFNVVYAPIAEWVEEREMVVSWGRGDSIWVDPQIARAWGDAN